MCLIVPEPNDDSAPKKSAWADLTRQDISSSDPTLTAALTLLVKDVLADNHSAVSKFSDLFYLLVKKIAIAKLRLLRDERSNISYDAEDLTQWAWLYIVKGVRLKSRSNYTQNPSPLKKWLVDPRISLSQYVGSCTRYYLMDIFALKKPLTETPYIISDDDKHLTISIQECWGRLCEEERQILDLLLIKGLTLAEAGAKLKRPTSSVFNQSKAAKNKLRTCLGAKYPKG